MQGTVEIVYHSFINEYDVLIFPQIVNIRKIRLILWNGDLI
ncbi:hypothetical protein CCYN2B_220020 [Capnocytophaga cynodegmi]|uniref:Uncharacterized protein n=1 Tax=Capnocytophaga cynodegmi TaxID=28189 RepID=A0A0B7HJ88_9FLAO|nr:hypothetical protein CCYN2B_220020 [Capnocytophaga cynodegmi]CEN37474.1 hypothetical protein CCYN49044_20160 [Capnocytophaga cynodegmi]CEN39781.1 hypothetical protein CCYN74_40065 [Capnocytophaga cynodegmi]